eukprot:TRINITY_DN9845_c0_g1_i1.p1 TRINITY_DN9845_c0_g1~~TRINITY_DN9845_c0_g1_i1.p1  ORF type:complete len:501 (-),score=71.16 TRINITY_DN9845_c0_g1_i1:15-1517(-)
MISLPEPTEQDDTNNNMIKKQYSNSSLFYSPRQKRNNFLWICSCFIVLSLWLIYVLVSSSSNSEPESPNLTSGPGITSEKCKTPYPGRSLLKFVLVIDAGSTGSRIHVYKFNYCRDSPDLETEVFEQLKPGLSAYPDNPEAAAESLDKLLDVALREVPSSLYSTTPVTVKATAGLRILGEEKSHRILAAVRSRLENRYPFHVVPATDGVAIMDGKDEGVYAWITVNYLLGVFGGETKVESSGVMDLGGGSTQIVFEPVTDPLREMPAGEHRYELEFGGKRFVLYQHSYLGYGLIEARKQITQLVMGSLDRSRVKSTRKKSGKVQHPCYASNHTEVIMLDGSAEEVTLFGSPLQRKCKTLAEKILKKDQLCPLPPCGFAGIYQPKLVDLPQDRAFYAFSYFFDQISPLVGGAERVSVGELRGLTDSVCTGKRDGFEGFADAMRGLDSNPAYCLDLSYMYALLSFGYEFPDEREIRLVKKIRGVETGWCLGAAFALIDLPSF